MAYKIGNPLIVYRKSEGRDSPYYKSCVTSFCTITEIVLVKKGGVPIIDFEEFLEMAGNKTVFCDQQMHEMFDKKPTIVLVGMIYNGYFGKGNNINYQWLKGEGLFNSHPYQIQYTDEQFKKILGKGKIDVQNVIVDQPTVL